MSCLSIDEKDIKHYTFEDNDEFVLAANNYAHWVISVDFTTLREHLDYMKTAKEIVYNASQVFKDTHPHFYTLYSVIEDDYNEADSLYDDILLFYTNEEDYRKIESPTPNGLLDAPILTRFKVVDTAREARQAMIGLAAGFGAIVGTLGATIFGLFNQGKVDDIASVAESNSQRIEDVIHVVQNNSAQIRLQAKDINLLARSAAKLTDAVAHTQTDLDYSVATVYVDHIVKNVKSKLDLFKDVIRAAISHRLSFGLVTYNEARDAISGITSSAAPKGLKPLISDPHQLLQLHTSMSRRLNGFKLLVHVPLYHEGQLFRLQKYTPFPIYLTEKLVFKVVPDKKLLAISDETFLEMDGDMLETCTKIGKIFVCNNVQQIDEISDRQSCLVALYHANHSKAIKLCKLFLHHARDEALPIAHNKFLVYSTNPSVYTVICANGTRISKQLKKIDIVTLDSSCIARFPEFRLQSRSSMTFTKPLNLFKWNIPSLNLFNQTLDTAALEKSLEKLMEKPLPVGDFHEILNAHKIESSRLWRDQLNWAYLGGFFFLFVALAFIIICYVKSAKKATTYDPVGRTERTTVNYTINGEAPPQPNGTVQ